MKQREGSFQERIQKLIEFKGGKVNKNHGDMTSEPGQPDLTVGYKGIYIAIEVKEEGNTPSRQQGVCARNLWRTNNICFVTWNIDSVKLVLEHLDNLIFQNHSINYIIQDTHKFINSNNIDDGTRW